jgi:hypothetical protein
MSDFTVYSSNPGVFARYHNIFLTLLLTLSASASFCYSDRLRLFHYSLQFKTIPAFPFAAAVPAHIVRSVTFNNAFCLGFSKVIF